MFRSNLGLQSRLRRTIAGGLIAAVGASLVSAMPAQASALRIADADTATSRTVDEGWEPIAPYDPAELPDQRPEVEPELLVTARDVQSQPEVIDAQQVSSPPTAVRFPQAGSATISAASGTEVVDTAAGPLARAGDLPVLLSPPTSTEQREVRVSVLGQRESGALGFDGVVFSANGLGAEAASIGFDYSSFAQARGGNYGDRLQLVALPNCVLTDPSNPLCRGAVRLESVNDAARHQLTVTLTKAEIEAIAAAGETSGPEENGELGTVVFAAFAGAAGSEGDFTASSLAPSGSWTNTGSSGGFGWTYPIQAPPPGTGSAPSVGLSYNSQAVDGRVASTNNQSSWLGQGWDYSTGFVERTYRTCDELPGTPSDGHTGDMCWAGQILTMSLGGATSALVQDEESGEWHPQNDNGERVERLTGSSNGALDGEYWKITTTDGVQYYFGLHRVPGSTPANATNSVFTMPVFGAKQGDPCYQEQSFAQSSCVQGWRWNLDYVVDPHGNATVNYYVAEKNYYGRAESTTPVGYTRSGYLSRIDYGLHLENGTLYGAPASQRIMFNVKERCLPTSQMTCKASDFTAANADRWPDTPFDLKCASAGACDVHTPTFWSTKQLSSIVTAYYDLAAAKYLDVDEFELTQTFHSGLPGGQMTLDSIVHTGHAADGTSTTLPPVKFLNTAMNNRVDGLNDEPAMPFYRLTKITAETDSSIAVSYGQPVRSDGGAATKCTATSVPADVAANKKLCFPVKWTLPYQDSPTVDYFHKYVVTQVVAADKTGLTPSQKTSYKYLGAPAWHLDDNEVVIPADRSHGQFRGYAAVETRGGDSGNASNGVADKIALTRASYLRGLGGSVQNSLGDNVPDPDELAGSVHEVQVFDGAIELSTTVTGYSVINTTGARSRIGLPDLKSKVIRPDTTRNVTSLVAGGNRTLQTVSSFDDLGRITAQSETGTGVPAVCTSYLYAENLASWIRDRPAEEIVSAQACPDPVEDPTPVESLTRTFYDGSETVGQITGPADPTLIQTATEKNGDTYKLARTKFTFDKFGRTLSTTAFASAQDVTGRKTSTAYTPSGVGPVTQVVTTNALGQPSTLKTTAGRGLTWSSTDVGGSMTEAFYDPLGRTTKVYRPGQVRANGDFATQTFSYLLNTNGPSSVTTKTLVDVINSKSYAVTVDLYDSLGQAVQTQTDAEDQKDENGDSTGKNRVVSDTFYDSHGWVIGSNNSWYTSGGPSTGLVFAAQSAINNRTVAFFDGAGRQTKTKAYRGLTEISSSSTSFGGDRTTVLPVSGGTTSTQISDARGNVTAVREYRTAPVVDGNEVTGGTFWETDYSHDSLGRLKTMTDADGAVWSYDYDMVGRQIEQHDPDAGVSTTTYNDTGNVLSTTDARGVTLTYAYDKLGRKVSEKSGATTLATWTWDSLRKGYQTSSTRFNAGNAYTIAATGYDKQGNALGRKVTIPAAEGQLAGSYTHLASWTSTGLLDLDTRPAAHGMSDEVIDHAYTRLGRPTGTSGDNAYAIDTVYTPFGEANQITLGVNVQTGWLTVNRFDHSRRISDIALDIQAGTPQVEAISYLYDSYGNITRSKDIQGGTDEAPVQTTCFDHDTLGRLRQAWSSSNSCATTPTPAAYATVQGAQPFWTTWDFDSVGNRTKQINRATAGKPGNTVTTYEYNSPAHKHALTKFTSTDPDDKVTVGTYGYTESGSVETRTQPGKNLNVIYGPDGRTDTITSPSGVTKYIYDADGNILVRRDPGGVRTVFNGDDQYRYDDGKTSGTRFYKHAGYTVMERANGKPVSFVFSDINGTPLASVQTAAQGFIGISRRHFDPYGKSLGGAQGTWPDRNEFLNQPSNVPDLIDMGARLYDPSLGRFLAVDPILTPYDPRQNNGYNYGWNNPLTHPDSTGLWSDAADTFHYKDYLRHSALTGASVIPQDRAALDFLNGRNHVEPGRINWKELGNAVAGVIAAVVITAGCTALTAGVGVAGCAAVGGAVGSAYTSAANGDSAGTILASAAVGGVTGGIGGWIGKLFARSKAPSYSPAVPIADSPAIIPPTITQRYVRPNGATNTTQREAMQGHACVTCGAVTKPMHADHIEPLVKEYYRTGTIDIARMRSLEAVQPQCPTCSHRQGGNLSAYSRAMAQKLGLP